MKQKRKRKREETYLGLGSHFRPTKENPRLGPFLHPHCWTAPTSGPPKSVAGAPSSFPSSADVRAPGVSHLRAQDRSRTRGASLSVPHLNGMQLRLPRAVCSADSAQHALGCCAAVDHARAPRVRPSFFHVRAHRLSRSAPIARISAISAEIHADR